MSYSTKSRSFAVKVSILSLAGILIVAAALFLVSGNRASADINPGAIDIWWPTNDTRIAGLQPFKAILKDREVGEYQMYWQVDDGQLNKMSNSDEDYPHKQSKVNLDPWTWNGSGPYTVTFVAQSNSGEEIATRSVVIHVERSGRNLSRNESDARDEPDDNRAPENESDTAGVEISEKKEKENNSFEGKVGENEIDIWWPKAGETLTGTQPFKVVVKDVDVKDYTMYWLVDGDRKNRMNNDYTDYPHKEARVDLGAWTWNKRGTYEITFIAEKNGREISKKSIEVHVPNNQTLVEEGSFIFGSAAAQESTEYSVEILKHTTVASGPFYVNPFSPAKTQAALWRSEGRNADADKMEKIASSPVAVWLGGWNNDVREDAKSVAEAAEAEGKTAVFVVYNIPKRDCGGYSAGGAGSGDAYRSWIQNIKAGIGNTNAVVVLEPDALASMDCLSSNDQNERINLLAYAVDTLQSGNVSVYIDAGHTKWQPAHEIAKRLQRVGVEKASGFALNVSNFEWTSDNIEYGRAISNETAGSRFVIDTSRNGAGPNGGEWCNPWGRKLGFAPTFKTGADKVDAYLWLKTPGESDGTCNGGPSAGTWWPEYALELAR